MKQQSQLESVGASSFELISQEFHAILSTIEIMWKVAPIRCLGEVKKYHREVFPNQGDDRLEDCVQE